MTTKILATIGAAVILIPTALCAAILVAVNQTYNSETEFAAWSPDDDGWDDSWDYDW